MSPRAVRREPHILVTNKTDAAITVGLALGGELWVLQPGDTATVYCPMRVDGRRNVAVIRETTFQAWRPSDECCLNFGCENPDVCNEIGFSCGDPRGHLGNVSVKQLQKAK